MASDRKDELSVNLAITTWASRSPIRFATAILCFAAACGTESRNPGAPTDSGLADGHGPAIGEFGSSDASSEPSPCASGASNGGLEVPSPYCVPDAAEEPARPNDAGVDSGSSDSDSSNDALSMQSPERDAAADAVACAVDAGRCAPGEYCVDSVFFGNYPREPDGAYDPPPPSEFYSCGVATCSDDAEADCPCQLCSGGGGSCQATGQIVTCTTYAVCAAADTPIATADGDRPISTLRPGELVYSADRGALRLVPLLSVHKTRVFHHRVVELTLANGETLRMSAGHPTADGRRLEQIQPGDLLDGILVLAARQVPYADPFTYDILPASQTHTYVASGVLVGTTLVDR